MMWTLTPRTVSLSLPWGCLGSAEKPYARTVTEHTSPQEPSDRILPAGHRMVWWRTLKRCGLGGAGKVFTHPLAIAYAKNGGDAIVQPGKFQDTKELM